MKSTQLKPVLCSGVSVLAVCAIVFAAPSMAQDAPKAASVSAPADGSATTVVITTRRKALQSATDRKKNSDTMIDSVVADDAGKLPDNSITEVLQRVAGVTIVRFASLGDPDHFSAEGSGIQVRGMSGITGTLNGHEVFSANGGGGLSWGDVTPELMAAVDVYKANRADQIEGGTGGSIDLRTKMPFDYKKPAFNASLGYSYGDYIKKGSPSGSLLATKRWDTPIGEVGALVDLAYSDYNAGDSFIRAEPYFERNVGGVNRLVPGGLDWGDDQFNRKRTGLYEALQWRPNDQVTVSQTFFQSEYKSHNTGTGVFVGDRGEGYGQAGLAPAPGTNAVYDANGALVSADHVIMTSNGSNVGGGTVGQGWIPTANQANCNAPYGAQAQSLNWSTSPSINGGQPYCTNNSIGVGSSNGFSTSDNITRDFTQGVTWIVSDRLRVETSLQFVDSSAHSSSFGIGLSTSAITGYSQNLSGNFPVFTIDNASALTNKSNYTWASYSDNATKNHGTMGALQLDVDYDLGNGFFKSLKVGGRYADRVERDNFFGTYWAPLGAGWNTSPTRDLTAGSPNDTSLYSFNNFFKGKAQLPGLFYLPSAALVQSMNDIYLQQTYGFSGECKTEPTYNGPCVGGVNTPTSTVDNIASYIPSIARTKILTKSVYVETKFGSDTGLFGVPFTGNAGLRVVRNEVTASGNFTFGANSFYLSQADANADLAAGNTKNLVVTTASYFDRAATNSYTRYLPSVNINFKPTDKFFIRFAANETMSPPNYSDIKATGSGGISTTANTNNHPNTAQLGQPSNAVNLPNIITGVTESPGNPYLLPTMSSNVDLAAEWYPSNSFNAHVDVFHKDLKDLIVYGDTFKPFVTTFTKSDGSQQTYSTTITSTESFNASQMAHISGFELGGRKFFDSLPEPFDGLGVEANYTLIDSHNPSAKALDILGNPIKNIPIVGMSRENYNIQLMYEKRKISVRLAYSWRSKYLQSTNSNGTNGQYCYTPAVTTTGSCPSSQYTNISLPVYGSAYGQIDFGFNYTVNDRLKLWIQANNITNATTKTSMEILPGEFYTRSWFISDQRVDAGINLAF